MEPKRGESVVTDHLYVSSRTINNKNDPGFVQTTLEGQTVADSVTVRGSFLSHASHAKSALHIVTTPWFAHQIQPHDDVVLASTDTNIVLLASKGKEPTTLRILVAPGMQVNLTFGNDAYNDGYNDGYWTASSFSTRGTIHPSGQIVVTAPSNQYFEFLIRSAVAEPNDTSGRPYVLQGRCC